MEAPGSAFRSLSLKAQPAGLLTAPVVFDVRDPKTVIERTVGTLLDMPHECEVRRPWIFDAGLTPDAGFVKHRFHHGRLSFIWLSGTRVKLLDMIMPKSDSSEAEWDIFKGNAQ